MIRLGVWVTFPDGGRQLAGETVCEGNRGAFRHTREYVADPKAFPLDPTAFPLEGGPFPYDRAGGIAAVFEDSLPDDWGRRLLVRRASLARAERSLPNLLVALGADGLGALSYAPKGAPAPPRQLPSLPELAALLDAAERMERGDEIEEGELRLLLAAGSSAGGARPKALLLDEGVPVLAKFPRPGDVFDIVGLEAGTMALARRAGLEVPEFRVERIGEGKKALILRRFDVVANAAAAGRRHMVSFQTLLHADGYYQLGYEDLLGVVRRVSAQPEIDAPRLFRQAVFNAVVGNTDDHLKNFAMLHDERGYHLSPAYDLLPGVQGGAEHVLHYSHGHICPSRQGLVALGRRAGVPSSSTIVDEVVAAAAGFRDAVSAEGVPEDQTRRLWELQVSRNLGRCA